MLRTPLYVVCSPRPLVGKTLVARLLSEFLLLQRRAIACFDINLKEPSLLDYLPKHTETAEIGDTLEKIALIDRLIIPDGVAKVLDLGFHAFDEFFKMSDEIGFMAEAEQRGMAPIVLFVADTDRISAWAYSTLRQQIPERSLVIVDNDFVLRGKLPAAFAHSRTLTVGALPVFLKTYINRLNFSFTEYLRMEKDSSTELHQWIRKNYSSCRELEMGLRS